MHTLNEYHNIIINTNLTDDYELSVWLKLMHDTDNINKENFLYTLIYIYVPYMFEGTHCKYIFNVDSNSINIGIQSNEFSRLNSSAFIYENDCPSSYVSDIIRTTPYKIILIYVPYMFQGTYCKYIFNVDSNSINIGLQNNEFSRLNSSAFIYENDCPSSYVSDIIRTTPYQINWNAIMEVNMSIIETPTYAFIMMPKNNYITGGTNFNFTKNEFSMSIVNLGDDFYNYDEYYLFWMKNFTENERYIKLNLTFSSSPVFWNVTIGDLENTSTAETISLAKTILI